MDEYYVDPNGKVVKLGQGETIPPYGRPVGATFTQGTPTVTPGSLSQVVIPSTLNFANAATTAQQQQQLTQSLLAPQNNGKTSNGTGTKGSGTGGSGTAAAAAAASIPGNQQGPTISVVGQRPPPMPSSFVGQIPFFLNAVLSTPAGALPKGPLWVVVFDFDNYIKNTIKSVSLYEPQMPEKWQIEKALDTITSKRYQEEKGCILAQSVSIPGESIITNAEGTQYNGFIRSYVGQGRQDFSALRMSFLNTNVSFVDNVIRPWTVMTGHLGLIARPRSEKYRCNITVYKLGVNTVDTPPFVAQKFNFYGACPTEVEEETYNYEAAMTIVKSATFVYQWYTTSSAENLFAQS